MKNPIRSIVSTAVFAAVLLFSYPADACQKGDGVLIHLSAGPDQAHRVLMGLKMALTMKDSGKSVLVYCDIDAVKWLVREAPVIKHKGFKTSADFLLDLVAKKVAIRACPSCLAAAGKSPEDLIPGVKTANADEFFSFAEGRIITLDY